MPFERSRRLDSQVPVRLELELWHVGEDVHGLMWRTPRLQIAGDDVRE